MVNIHIPEGQSLTDYVAEALANAIENGDAAFLRSLEDKDADSIVEDMCAYDAGIEWYVYEEERHVDEAKATVKACVNEYLANASS